MEAERAQQLHQLRRIAPTSLTDIRLVRCDGSRQDLAAYERRQFRAGWQLKATPEPGDLLFSTYGTGHSRTLVSICLVDAVTRAGDAVYDPANDLHLKPSIAWSSLVGSGSRRVWTQLEGLPARDVLKRVRNLIRHPEVLSDIEGEKRAAVCRHRSRRNRDFVLVNSHGLCGACHGDFLETFADLGYRALEVHHLDPLAGTEPVIRETAIDRLIALCASCHRLVHAYPDVRVGLNAVQAAWGTTS